MQFSIKKKPEHLSVREEKGFAWFPKSISETKRVWLERYTRHHIYYGTEWTLYDPENQMILHGWNWVPTAHLAPWNSQEDDEEVDVESLPFTPKTKKKIKETMKASKELKKTVEKVNRLNKVA